MLGGFKPIGHLPFYVLTVTAKHGQHWTLKVTVDEENRRYSIVVIDEVPWQFWDGSPTGSRPLIDGDEPIQSSMNRMKTQRVFPRMAK